VFAIAGPAMVANLTTPLLGQALRYPALFKTSFR